MRKASIDLGTNSFLLTIAEVQDDQIQDVLVDTIRLVQLGQDVDRSGVLHPDAKERAYSALREFHALCEEYSIKPSAVHAVGTSALRDARDRSEFVEYVRQHMGFNIRVIPGDEEALWSYRGALSSLPLSTSAQPMLIDIGGGSTELVWEDGVVCHSLDIGVVRAKERFLKSDPPTETECEQLRSALLEALHALPPRPTPEPLLAVAGTPTTLVALHKGLESYDGALVHGSVLKRDTLRKQLQRLSSVSLEERKTFAGLHPKRADLIIGGAVILLTLMEELRQEELLVSDRGLRYGLLLGS